MIVRAEPVEPKPVEVKVVPKPVDPPETPLVAKVKPVEGKPAADRRLRVAACHCDRCIPALVAAR